MNAAAIRARRLAGQFLTTLGPARAEDVVRALGAVQAQDYAGAKWALSMRARDATDAAIEHDVNTGRILRTHVLRPTWHFVAPEDIRWMLALTGPRIAAAMASYNRKMELTRAVFSRANRAIERALRDGRHLTRAELKTHLERARVGTTGMNRLAHIVMQAEIDGVVCSGPRAGNQFTYALLDERLPACRAWDRDEALGELATRYFRSRSPATVHDFAWWSGLTVADAKRAVDIAGPMLERRATDDATWWIWADAPPAARGRSAHLLPNYDEYFIGFRDRSAMAPRPDAIQLVTGGSTLINHVVVVDGQLVGGWKRVTRASGVEVKATYLAPLSPSERRMISRQRSRLERHVGAPVALYPS